MWPHNHALFTSYSNDESVKTGWLEFQWRWRLGGGVTERDLKFLAVTDFSQDSKNNVNDKHDFHNSLFEFLFFYILHFNHWWQFSNKFWQMYQWIIGNPTRKREAAQASKKIFYPFFHMGELLIDFTACPSICSIFQSEPISNCHDDHRPKSTQALTAKPFPKKKTQDYFILH